MMVNLLRLPSAGLVATSHRHAVRVIKKLTMVATSALSCQFPWSCTLQHMLDKQQQQQQLSRTSQGDVV